MKYYEADAAVMHQLLKEIGDTKISIAHFWEVPWASELITFLELLENREKRGDINDAETKQE